MADDDLNHDELVRLESLTRAINHASLTPDTIDASTIVENANKFENFIKNGSANA